VVPTYPLFNGTGVLAWWRRQMFLRAKVRKKDGKQQRYFSVVENRRVGPNQTAQRTVLYLGEINDSITFSGHAGAEYPPRLCAEATKHVLPGCKSLGRPVAVCAAVVIQAIDGTRSFTSQESQPCRLLPTPYRFIPAHCNGDVSLSFIPQRLNGIQVGGTNGGNHATNQCVLGAG
jgi:hypothetical protein